VIRAQSRRGGFTLIELLVVIALLALLGALAAGTFYRVQNGQRVGASEATMQKLHTGLARMWTAALDEAKEDVQKDRVPATVVQLAGNDKDRTRAIWSYLKLKQYFPTTVAEATTDIQVGGVTVLPHLKVFDRLAAAAAAPPEKQSAACFYLLTEVSVRGERLPTEGLEQQTAEIDLAGGVKARVFVDAWGEPIAFVRLGYSGETDQSPYVKPNLRVTAASPTQINASDPLDPLGKLLTNAPGPASNPGWNRGKLQLFWQAAAAGTSNPHWQYPGFPTTSPDGYPLQGGAGPVPRNPTPTLVSAGPNKAFGTTSLFGDPSVGPDEDAADNLFSFRQRREGTGGN
jgi:prepilin-type N-terminal cleavage/methylation domain-containing protein